MGAALALEALEIRLPGTVGLRAARRHLGVEVHARRRRRLHEWQALKGARERRGLEVEVAAHAGDERRLRLVAERRAREGGALVLRDRHHVDLADIERELRREANDALGCGREERVLLVAHRHLPCAREERVGTQEGDAAEVVVHAIVLVALEQPAVEREALGVRAHLHRAERERTRVATTFGVVTEADAVRGLRMLRRVQILAGRGVDRLAGRVAGGLGESGARERPERREDQEVVAQDSGAGRPADGDIGIAGAWEEPVVNVEGCAVARLREPEQLQPRIADAGERLLLVAGRAGDDAGRDGTAAHVLAADPVDGADLAIERRVGGTHLRVPEQRRVLVAVGVLEVRGAAGGGHGGVAAVHAHRVRHDQPLVVQVERADERHPEQGLVGVVVHVLAHQLVDLAAPRRGVADELELRTVGIRRLPADEQTVQEDARRPHRIGERRCESLQLRAVEQVDVGEVGEAVRIDGEEETPRLDLVILDFAVHRLHRAVADREDPVLGDVALLLGDDGAKAHRPQLAHGLKAVVAAGNAAGDEPACRRLEGDVADLELLDQLVALPLVVDLDVVGRVELALAVVVHVEVNPLRHDAARAHVELEVEERLEAPLALRGQAEELAADAALVLGAVDLALEPSVECQAEIGVLPEQVGGLRAQG